MPRRRPRRLPPPSSRRPRCPRRGLCPPPHPARVHPVAHRRGAAVGGGGRHACCCGGRASPLCAGFRGGWGACRRHALAPWCVGGGGPGGGQAPRPHHPGRAGAGSRRGRPRPAACWPPGVPVGGGGGRHRGGGPRCPPPHCALSCGWGGCPAALPPSGGWWPTPSIYWGVGRRPVHGGGRGRGPPRVCPPVVAATRCRRHGGRGRHAGRPAALAHHTGGGLGCCRRASP